MEDNQPQNLQVEAEDVKSKFSWKRIFKVLGIIIVPLAVILGIYFVVISRPAKILYASLFKNNREIFMDCQDLPFFQQVQKEMGLHSDVVEKIKNAGASKVEAIKINCLSSDKKYSFIKGNLLIVYHSRCQRSSIEKLIGDNFFGIPWRGEDQ